MGFSVFQKWSEERFEEWYLMRYLGSQRKELKRIF